MLSFGEYGFSQTHIFVDKDKMVDSVLIRENTGQKKPVFSHILRSDIYLRITTFVLYIIHKNVFFLLYYMQMIPIQTRRLQIEMPDVC